MLKSMKYLSWVPGFFSRPDRGGEDHLERNLNTLGSELVLVLTRQCPLSSPKASKSQSPSLPSTTGSSAASRAPALFRDPLDPGNLPLPTCLVSFPSWWWLLTSVPSQVALWSIEQSRARPKIAPGHGDQHSRAPFLPSRNSVQGRSHAHGKMTFSVLRRGSAPSLPFVTWPPRASVSSVQSLSHVQLFATPWTAARQVSLSIPGACSDSCPLSQWCHPTISSSVIPFSSCLQSFPASGSFPMSQLFTSGGQSIGVSASASGLPMNIQDWFPLGWTGWISLQSKGLSSSWCWTSQHHGSKASILQCSALFVVFLYILYISLYSSVYSKIVKVFHLRQL